jgi:hypothetical protein
MRFTGTCSSHLRRAALAALAAACLAAGAARAQEQQQQPWSKPLGEWTREDAQKVLQESPWARSQTIKVQQHRTGRIAGAPNPIGPDGNPAPISTVGNTAVSGGAQAPIDYTFTLRLRSALPVRQALARLMQLDAVKLKDKERAAQETRIKGTLDCPACADNYVVTLSSRSEESQGSDPVYAAFAGARIDDIKRFIYLANDRGDRRDLVHFVPPRSPGEEAVFFFPRHDERGEPLLTSTSRKLIFNVTKVEVSTVANFQIDVADITDKGKIVF